jgi:hypothetical protein
MFTFLNTFCTILKLSLNFEISTKFQFFTISIRKKIHLIANLRQASEARNLPGVSGEICQMPAFFKILSQEIFV